MALFLFTSWLNVAFSEVLPIAPVSKLVSWITLKANETINLSFPVYNLLSCHTLGHSLVFNACALSY